MKHLHEAVTHILPDAISMRRHLHSHPELSGQELETRAYICQKLDQWGISYRLCTRNLGIIADIGQGSPCVAIRADMDALPITEQTGLPYASQVPGVMHACGHDVHMAVLLSVGKLLKDMESELKGTVRLLFQPAEETTGGAADMIAEGCLENPHVSAVLGFHVDPGTTAGAATFYPGTSNAAVSDFTLAIHGKSSHGAWPHEGVDAIVAASHVVSALQSIVSRNLAPTQSGVVTIGTIQGGTKENIICDCVTMTGTVRALSADLQSQLTGKVRHIATHAAEALGASAQVSVEDLYPPLVNDTALTEGMISLSQALLGPDRTVRLSEPSLGADDFAFFSQSSAGCYFNVGARTEGLPGQALHSCVFEPNEACMETAILLAFAGALQSLNHSF